MTGEYSIGKLSSLIRGPSAENMHQIVRSTECRRLHGMRGSENNKVLLLMNTGWDGSGRVTKGEQNAEVSRDDLYRHRYDMKCSHPPSIHSVHIKSLNMHLGALKANRKQIRERCKYTKSCKPVVTSCQTRFPKRSYNCLRCGIVFQRGQQPHTRRISE
jgi:hypothetical protein